MNEFKVMGVIAHRGYWIEASEQNKTTAFKRALQNNFGIETDFRDMNGRLVVSHDAPLLDAFSAESFINLYKLSPSKAPMALNVKSDGIQLLVKELIDRAGMSNCFAFDMSVPDMRGYISEGIPIFTRMSDYEPTPAFLNQSFGVWLDAFESQWYDIEVIKNLLGQNKKIAIVSPELHHRSHKELWYFLKKNNLHLNPLISICTDFPLEALEYFYG